MYSFRDLLTIEIPRPHPKLTEGEQESACLAHSQLIIFDLWSIM